MPNYDLNGLGHSEFERLYQSLLKKIIGVETITFGSGPDGGREATYTGKSNYYIPGDRRLAGNWIFQAKFHDTTNVPNPQKIVLQNLRKELMKILKNRLPCDNYFMGTNVPLSSVHEKGALDKIELIKQEFRNRVPNIVVWGYDEICRFIDNYQDVRYAYLHLITPGDVLSSLLSRGVECHFKNIKKNVIAQILYFLDAYPDQLPTVGRILSNSPLGISRKFDPILVEDFVENHYPYIRVLWERMCDLNSKVKEKRDQISKIVSKNLRNAVRREPYRYLDQQHRYHQLCYREFEDTLVESILKCQTPCAKIYEDTAQPRRIKFIHRNIYMLNEGDDSLETVSRLRTLCRNLAYNKRVKQQLMGESGYKALAEKQREHLVSFKKELGIIINSESLRVLKNDDNSNKCHLL